MVKPCDPSQLRDFGRIFRRQTVALSDFLRGQPVVIVWRLGVAQLIDVLPKRLFPFGRASQLEEHMLYPEAVSDRPAIILCIRFRTRVPSKRDQFCIVDRLGDQRAWVALALQQLAESPRSLPGRSSSPTQRDCDCSHGLE